MLDGPSKKRAVLGSYAQAPPLQVLLPGQAMPQKPQLNLLVCRFTQFPEQRVRPGAHTQLPALHTSTPPGQPRLQVPQ